MDSSISYNFHELNQLPKQSIVQHGAQRQKRKSIFPRAALANRKIT
jgi:hypothetical protein